MTPSFEVPLFDDIAAMSGHGDWHQPRPAIDKLEARQVWVEPQGNFVRGMLYAIPAGLLAWGVVGLFAFATYSVLRFLF